MFVRGVLFFVGKIRFRYCFIVWLDRACLSSPVVSVSKVETMRHVHVLVLLWYLNLFSQLEFELC